MNERVLNCISAAFDLPVEDVTDNISREDVEQWDSIGSIRLALCLEEEFGVSISPEAARRMTGCREILAELRKLGASL